MDFRVPGTDPVVVGSRWGLEAGSDSERNTGPEGAELLGLDAPTVCSGQTRQSQSVICLKSQKADNAGTAAR